jgi:hypothetical protein
MIFGGAAVAYTNVLKVLAHSWVLAHSSDRDDPFCRVVAPIFRRNPPCKGKVPFSLSPS